MANYENSLKLVKEHLESSEVIQSSIYGSYEVKLMGNDSTRNGVFIATEKRLVFYAKKLFGYDMESFPFKNISSIEKSKGFMGHTITIYASGNKASMKWINKGDVVKFTDYVNSKIGNTEQPIIQQQPIKEDILSQIEKLGELKEKGILTENEFESKKIELLAKL